MRYRILGILAAIPVWMAIVALLAWTIAQAFARYAFNTVLLSSVTPPGSFLSWDDAFVYWAGFAFLAAIPFALLFVLLEAVAGDSAADGDDVRSPLAVWPGLPLAIVITAVSAVASLASKIPIEILLLQAQRGAQNYVLVGIVLAVATATGLTGGRPKRGIVAVAGPLVLVMAIAEMLALPIARLLLMLTLPCLVLAAAFLILSLATREKGAIWWSLGFLLVALTAGMCAPGLVTPTEAIAILAAVSLPVGMIVNSAVRQTPIGTALIVAGTEIAAIAAVFAVTFVSGYLLAINNVTAALAPLVTNMPGQVLLAACIVAVAVASYLMTPTLAFGILAFQTVPLLARAGIDSAVFATLAMLAAVAAMLLRSVRPRHAPPPLGASLATLSSSPAIGMSLFTILVLVLTAIALLYLSLAPPR